MSIDKKAVIAGFAIFAMTFGAGNVVFPLMIGREQDANFLIGSFGWLLTSVLVPLVGYFGALLFDGDSKLYLKPFGKIATFILVSVFMMMAGPFGVSARSVNVGFGGISVVCPELSAFVFNCIFCVIAVILAWNPGKIIELMGTVFTPLKFCGVIVVVVGAMVLGCPLSGISESSKSACSCFYEGFNLGFQTMDLLAAFLMASSVFLFLKKSLPEDKKDDKKILLSFSLQACCVAAVIFFVVYMGLIIIGAQYSGLTKGVPSESIFTKIAELSMGSWASWFVSIVIAVSCLGTNIALTSVFTDFVVRDVFKDKISRKMILVCVGVATFVTSMLGFEEICALLAKILNIVYPFLMVFVFVRIAHYFYKRGKEKDVL